MAALVADCPRCGAQKMTFDVGGDVFVDIKYKWQYIFEVFSVCRQCHKTTVFVLALLGDRAKVDKDTRANHTINSVPLVEYQGALNDMFSVEGFLSLKDHARTPPPEHLPPGIERVFREGVTCQAVECFNAASTMYRLCLDMATRGLLPSEEADGVDQPNARQRRLLKPRLEWLFEQGKLSEGLQDLSECVREDGNDGAHAGTLTKDDAEDLLDFAVALLERLYTEPEKVRLAQERRDKRRSGEGG